MPTLAAVFKKALDAGIKMPIGTDAVAGAHGQNAREILARVAAGQKPMAALTSATSVAATSLNLGDTIGVLAPDFQADIIAVAGNPLADINVMKNVRFVMKGGRVYSR